MRLVLVKAASWLMLILAAVGPARADDQPVVSGILKTVDAQKLTIDLPPPVGTRTLTLSGDAKMLAGAEPGDKVEIAVDNRDNPQKVTKIMNVSRAIGGQYCALALFVGFLIVFGLAVAAEWGNPKSFLLGMDNRYSNSKCQLAAWFGAVMAVYLAAIIARVWVWGLDAVGGVGIPEHLLELTGLSGLSFAGAKAITTQKVQNALADAPRKTAVAAQATAQATTLAAAAAAAESDTSIPPAVREAHKVTANAAANAAKSSATDADAAAAPKKAGTPNILQDLVTNDEGSADIGDFQMIFIAMVAVITFVLSGFNFLGVIARGPMTLPDVDTTLLSGFGIGQGAYLIKKLAAPLGKG